VGFGQYPINQLKRKAFLSYVSAGITSHALQIALHGRAYEDRERRSEAFSSFKIGSQSGTAKEAVDKQIPRDGPKAMRREVRHHPVKHPGRLTALPFGQRLLHGLNRKIGLIPLDQSCSQDAQFHKRVRRHVTKQSNHGAGNLIPSHSLDSFHEFHEIPSPGLCELK